MKDESKLIAFAEGLGIKVIPFSHHRQRLYWLRSKKKNRLLLDGHSVDSRELNDLLLRRDIQTQ